jgi:flagellum-specific peptidoglycan hydrolase FlgJ
MRMKFTLLLSFICIFCLTHSSAQTITTVEQKKAYLKKYAWIAIEEMKRVRIPASIKLAQAMIESNSGISNLANKANNHFGLKCGVIWSGETNFRYDDDRDRDGFIIQSCFRVYKSIKQSFVDHSAYLMSPEKSDRYSFLFTLDPMDYKAWAIGLQKGGYSTNPNYADILIRAIETFGLQELDKKTIQEMKTTRP